MSSSKHCWKVIESVSNCVDLLLSWLRYLENRKQWRRNVVDSLVECAFGLYWLRNITECSVHGISSCNLVKNNFDVFYPDRSTLFLRSLTLDITEFYKHSEPTPPQTTQFARAVWSDFQCRDPCFHVPVASGKTRAELAGRVGKINIGDGWLGWLGFLRWLRCLGWSQCLGNTWIGLWSIWGHFVQEVCQWERLNSRKRCRSWWRCQAVVPPLHLIAA